MKTSCSAIVALIAAAHLAACQAPAPRSAEVCTETTYRSAVAARTPREARGHALELAREWAESRPGGRVPVIAVRWDGRAARAFATTRRGDSPICLE
jgi:hypothetical protein